MDWRSPCSWLSRCWTVVCSLTVFAPRNVTEATSSFTSYCVYDSHSAPVSFSTWSWLIPMAILWNLASGHNFCRYWVTVLRFEFSCCLFLRCVKSLLSWRLVVDEVSVAELSLCSCLWRKVVIRCFIVMLTSSWHRAPERVKTPWVDYEETHCFPSSVALTSACLKCWGSPTTVHLPGVRGSLISCWSSCSCET